MVSLLWQCGGRAITPIKGECPAIKRQREWVEERHEGQSSIKKKIRLSSVKNKRQRVVTHGRTDKDVRVV